MSPQDALEQHQLTRFKDLLHEILPKNRFYTHKYSSILSSYSPDLTISVPQLIDSFHSISCVRKLPFVEKKELLEDQAKNPLYGSNLTYSFNQYTRIHQTSGTTTGIPLRWLDTPSSWEWITNCWRLFFPWVGIRSEDIFFFPFSFGPFLAFWSAFEAACRFGCRVIAGGGMSSSSRLKAILDHQATVICCTPTYALHLAEVAENERIDIKNSHVKTLIVAGEPGGSIPETKKRIENAWGAKVFDHYGLSEVGPIGIECQDSIGTMVILESEMIIEIIDPTTLLPAVPGEIGELVVTNLGRVGSPLIRYRTGDLTKQSVCEKKREWIENPGSEFQRLDTKSNLTQSRVTNVDGEKSIVANNPTQLEVEKPPAHWRKISGGIIGRTDDMIFLRGNNVYPSAIEGIIRQFPEIAEYRIVIDLRSSLPDLKIQIELFPHQRLAQHGDGEKLIQDRIITAIRDQLLFRVEIEVIEFGTLPRYELKAKRIHKIL